MTRVVTNQKQEGLTDITKKRDRNNTERLKTQCSAQALAIAKACECVEKD